MSSIEMNSFEADELINELVEERILRAKYNFTCPNCDAMNTIYSDEEISECQICYKPIDLKRCVKGASIRYVLNKDDFREYLEEQRPQLLCILDNKIDLIKEETKGVNVKEEVLEKKPFLFISHATLDKEVVAAFVNLFEFLGMTREMMFCSSVPGYDLGWGDDIYPHLADYFNNEKDLIVLFMLSDNYYNSPACLNEMGATWILKKEYKTLLFPGFEFKDIKGAINPNKIAYKMDDTQFSDQLDLIRDYLVDKFELSKPVDTASWSRHKRECMKVIQEYIEENQKHSK